MTFFTGSPENISVPNGIENPRNCDDPRVCEKPPPFSLDHDLPTIDCAPPKTVVPSKNPMY